MRFFVFILLLSFYSCKTHVNTLPKKCIDEQYFSSINKGVELFENKLSDKYPYLSIEEAYFKFIQDLSDKKLSAEFFHDESMDSISIAIKGLNLWDISERTKENMDREARLYKVQEMNPNTVKLGKDISYCLASQTDSDGIKNFLYMNSDYRLSPNRIRKTIYSGTSNIQLKNPLNRMVIALGVYYQTAFNIKN